MDLWKIIPAGSFSYTLQINLSGCGMVWETL